VVLSVILKPILSKERRAKWSVSLRGSKLADLGFWSELVRITLALITASLFHFLLKSSIYLINPRTWDPQLLRLDRALHFGISPSLFFLELFKSPVAYRVIDFYYAIVYGIIVVTYPSIFVAIAGKHLRRTFATAFTLVMILGWIGYAALPSWGPVFVQPQEFEKALSYMPMTVRIQSQLFEETSSLIRNPLGSRTIVYGGIAAFPSLHVAILTLFALVSRRISRSWFKANILLVVVMILGSVVTGYHYLIDAYAGLILGWGVYRLADYWVKRWERRVGEEESTPVTGSDQSLQPSL
jgi:membrane-associated phospholipid phosphatase